MLISFQLRQIVVATSAALTALMAAVSRFVYAWRKKQTLCAHEHTLSHCTHTHTQTYGERAQHSVRLSKILAFQRFFTCLCREKEKQFSMFTHFISPERRVVLSVPVPTPFPSSLHMPACLPGSHSVWQSPPFVPSLDRERFIECS